MSSSKKGYRKKKKWTQTIRAQVNDMVAKRYEVNHMVIEI